MRGGGAVSPLIYTLAVVLENKLLFFFYCLLDFFIFFCFSFLVANCRLCPNGKCGFWGVLKVIFAERSGLIITGSSIVLAKNVGGVSQGQTAI